MLLLDGIGEGMIEHEGAMQLSSGLGAASHRWCCWKMSKLTWRGNDFGETSPGVVLGILCFNCMFNIWMSYISSEDASVCLDKLRRLRSTVVDPSYRRSTVTLKLSRNINVASLTLSGPLLWFMKPEHKMNVTDGLLAGRGWSRFNLTRAGLNEMTEVKQKSSEIIVLIDYFFYRLLYFLSFKKSLKRWIYWKQAVFSPKCSECSATSLISSLSANPLHGEGRGIMIDAQTLWV